MKNVSRTKKMNNILALVVMMAVLVTSIGVVPAKAEGTFTVVTSPCTVALNSYGYAKNYITVKDGDKVLTLNVDYNYGSDILQASTTMITSNAGMWVWSGTVYGMGEYSGVSAQVALPYTVTAPVVTNPPATTPSTGTNPANSTTADNTTAAQATTATQTTEVSASTEKPIEGEVTFKKFMEKYCNYGYYSTKDGKGYTIGKTSNSKGLMNNYPCSPKYQYKINTTTDDGEVYKKDVGSWSSWDKNYINMANMALPARLWQKYTADGEVDAINCMLDDFGKLPVIEKQLHISNFVYGQILKAAAKVGRTVDVAVLPLSSSSSSELYSYGVNTNSDGVYVSYGKVRMDTSLCYSNIASSAKPVNKFEATWKCKGDTNWRTGSCATVYAAYSGLGASGHPMGKGNVYTVKGKQTNYWKDVTEIKIRQYRTINGTNYYTDWLTVYKDGKKVSNNNASSATSTVSSATKTKVKTKTIVKGKKAKVKVSYSKKQKIKWKVKNSKVVKIVKKAGKGYNTITIKGNKAGKTTITGKGKGKTFKIKVTVKKK